jgi:hypothetical protein
VALLAAWGTIFTNFYTGDPLTPMILIAILAIATIMSSLVAIVHSERSYLVMFALVVGLGYLGMFVRSFMS